MNKIVKNTLILTAITVVAGLLLGVVYGVTKDTIAKAQEKTCLLYTSNVTAKLRTEEVGNMASMTSAIPEVRGKLLELQRTLAREKDVIMDGRDIGTHVLPDADVKIYLTASVEIRAKRRYKAVSYTHLKENDIVI